MLTYWKKKADELKVQTLALYFAGRDPRVPWYAKAWIILVVAYAFSPIDLIPDFIPVLGYLDDLILVPLGIYIAIRMVPAQVMQECRAKASENLAQDKPQYRWIGVIVVAIWTILTLLIILWLARFFIWHQNLIGGWLGLPQSFLHYTSSLDPPDPACRLYHREPSPSTHATSSIRIA
jgi:uncharacterized membrane protein YkvA (DUF1232 family)